MFERVGGNLVSRKRREAAKFVWRRTRKNRGRGLLVGTAAAFVDCSCHRGYYVDIEVWVVDRIEGKS